MVWKLIDKVLTADCTVVELSKNFFVYPIFKNASSSIYKEQREKCMRTFKNNEIAQLNKIQVYIRDPKERIVSGLNTFFDTCIEKNIKDKVANYQYIDRHFMPQFFWLAHLVKYYKGDIVLLPFEQLTEVLKYKVNVNNKHNNNNHDIDLEKYVMLDRAMIKKYINKSVCLPALIKDLYGLSKT